MLKSIGKLKKKLSQFNIVPKPVEDSDLRSRLTKLFKEGNFEQVRALCDQKLITQPAHTSALYFKMLYYQEKRDYSKVLSLCKKLLALCPNSIDYLAHMSYCYFNLGQTTQAKKAIDKAKKIAPNNSMITFYHHALFKQDSTKVINPPLA